jgi:hypothetical protein
MLQPLQKLRKKTRRKDKELSFEAQQKFTIVINHPLSLLNENAYKK